MAAAVERLSEHRGYLLDFGANLSQQLQAMLIMQQFAVTAVFQGA